jgi:hypothetical protein
VPSSKAASEEPIVKQERIEKIEEEFASASDTSIAETI